VRSIFGKWTSTAKRTWATRELLLSRRVDSAARRRTENVCWRVSVPHEHVTASYNLATRRIFVISIDGVRNERKRKKSIEKENPRTRDARTSFNGKSNADDVRFCFRWIFRRRRRRTITERAEPPQTTVSWL